MLIMAFTGRVQVVGREAPAGRSAVSVVVFSALLATAVQSTNLDPAATILTGEAVYTKLSYWVKPGAGVT